MRVLMAVAALLTLSACTTEGLVSAAFPDREMLAFRSGNGEDVMRYACERGATDAETQSRAGKAHRYVDSSFEAFGERAGEALIRGIEEGRPSVALTIEMNRSADAAAEQIQTTAESRYQCMYVGNA